MTEKKKLIIYWSRRDFRLEDNPALWSAITESKETEAKFLPLFILENYMTRADSYSQFGYPSRYFLAQALPKFVNQFEQFVIARGKAAETLITLSSLFDVTIFVNEDVWIDFYKQIKKLKKHDVKVKIFKDFLTIDRETKTGQGNYYSIFTPFKNAVWKEFVHAEVKTKANPKPAIPLTPADLKLITGALATVEANTDALWNSFSHNRNVLIGKKEFDLDEHTEKPNLSSWYTSELDALNIFKAYLKSDFLSDYKNNRDSLEKDTESTSVGKTKLRGKTSKMSLALAWGLVSSRTLRSLIQKHFNNDFSTVDLLASHEGAFSFLSELIWREFYKYLYFHNTELMDTEFQLRFRGKIDWAEDSIAHKRFTSWIEGKTGYPIVDASMNQLAQTGWMHNRSRMIVASILTKNLGVDWRWGQEYFRATLIDLDETSNNGGWQWGASVGADPKPIRIFNAELQAKKYDSSGAYQKKWLPEGDLVEPIIEHKVGRDEALKRYGLSSHHKPRDY